ncbi:hypothetical protein KCV07_g517, partial [Aureobasidium melanogenum]
LFGRRKIGDIKSEEWKVLYGNEPKSCSKARMSLVSKFAPTSSAAVWSKCDKPVARSEAQYIGIGIGCIVTKRSEFKPTKKQNAADI